MFNSKFNGLLTALLVIAIIGIIALIGFFGWSVYNKYYLNSSAHDAIEAFEDSINRNNVDGEDGERGQIGGVEQGNSLYSQTGSGTTKYGGYNVIGTIEIPKINIEYPILEKATTQSIKIAVAYLSGARNQPSRKYCNTRT